MSRRTSSRIASQQSRRNAASEGAVFALGPVSKKRRKDPAKNPRPDGDSAQDHEPNSTEDCAAAPIRSAGPKRSAKRSAGSGPAPGSTAVMVDVPADFSLAQAACSYGYYLLPPNRWEPSKDEDDPDKGTFARPLRFGKQLEESAECVVSQVAQKKDNENAEARRALRVDVSAKLTKSQQQDIRDQVIRMFQPTLDLEPWFALSDESRERGYGRLFRGPTLFEDMVKCITGCNMTFSGTIRMNKLLCEGFGHNEAFPSPEDLEGVEAEDLKERAKVGYRSDRILRLAKNFRDGNIDQAWLEAPERTRDEVLKYVKNLHGFGDYAAGNVAMLLGFYEEVPMDSETVRHFKDVHGMPSKNVKEIAPKVKKQYEPYAPYQFLQYWFEMIKWYEKKHGATADKWGAVNMPF